MSILGWIALIVVALINMILWGRIIILEDKVKMITENEKYIIQIVDKIINILTGKE